MRVIAGQFKGRKLVSFRAPHIRPTTDRVKETLFNKLMGEIEGARILDLFSGTGGLALECLSRGADWVDLVENHKISLRIIRENLALCKVESGYKIHPIDVFSYLKKYRGDPYDVILADPPFTRQWANQVLETVSQQTSLRHSGTQIVVEASRQERVDEEYSGLKRLDQRGFGDKSLHFFTSG